MHVSFKIGHLNTARCVSGWVGAVVGRVGRVGVGVGGCQCEQ